MAKSLVVQLACKFLGHKPSEWLRYPDGYPTFRDGTQIEGKRCLRCGKLLAERLVVPITEAYKSDVVSAREFKAVTDSMKRRRKSARVPKPGSKALQKGYGKFFKHVKTTPMYRKQIKRRKQPEEEDNAEV